MNRVPRWRVAAGVLVLAILGGFVALFTPIYFHNHQLQDFVAALTHRVENQTKSDDLLRTAVLDKARQLDLPVTEDEVHIFRSPDGLRIEVRYLVPVNLPGYTVNLHFYPGAGSR
ncbi:MAG: hypothetical protein LAP87_10150 [Acidobacteriia bacterium]|nr:hypothetical protein [Terriglobia bacterium]